MIGGKFNNEVEVVRLDFCFVSRFVSHLFAAFFAFVDNYISSLSIRLCSRGAKNTAAGIRSVTGVYIHVKRAKAERAVIS